MIKYVSAAALLLCLTTPLHAQQPGQPISPAAAPDSAGTEEPSAVIHPSNPQETEYTKPKLLDLLHLLQGFKALDISKDDYLLDQYAGLVHCDLYAGQHSDEFKWRKIRELLAQEVTAGSRNYPTKLAYDANLQLDKYDFNKHMFRFTKLGGIININALTLDVKNKGGCNSDNINKLLANLPFKFHVAFSPPVYVFGIPLSEKDGEALLQSMAESGNRNRVIYSRFNLSVNYIRPLTKTVPPEEGTNIHTAPTYTQGLTGKPGDVKIDTTLDSIQFFMDPDHKVLLYTYVP